jgi:hypothetical protein
MKQSRSAYSRGLRTPHFLDFERFSYVIKNSRLSAKNFPRTPIGRTCLPPPTSDTPPPSLVLPSLGTIGDSQTAFSCVNVHFALSSARKSNLHIPLCLQTVGAIREQPRSRAPWLRIPPLPPRFGHFFTRWQLIKGYGRFAFPDLDLFSDCFDDLTPFLSLFVAQDFVMRGYYVANGCERPLRPFPGQGTQTVLKNCWAGPAGTV